MRGLRSSRWWRFKSRFSGLWCCEDGHSKVLRETQHGVTTQKNSNRF